MSQDIAIKAENVSKKYCKTLKRSMLYGMSDISRNILGLSSHSEKLRKDEFLAVNDVSFEVKRGETLGIIGPNGSGKTTMLKMLNGIFWPDKGKITANGRVGALIEVGAGFHPLLSGRENIYINAAILGMTKKEVDKKFDAIVEFADIGDFLDAPVKHYSSGMYVRLGFAVAVHCDPDILLIDEVLAVGDANFQSRCFSRISELIRQNNCTVVIVSHQMSHIGRIAGSALFLNHGMNLKYGNASEVIQAYRSYANDGLRVSNSTDKSSDDFNKIEFQVVTKNAANVITGQFLSGDSCCVELEYHARECIENPIVTLSFNSIYDDHNTHYSTKDVITNFVMDGKGLIRLHFPYLGLSSGIWRLSVGVFGSDYLKLLAWKWFIAEIEVSEPADNIMLGRFRMSHKWEIAKL